MLYVQFSIKISELFDCLSLTPNFLFLIVFLLFIKIIKIAIDTLSFAIIWFMMMRTRSRISCWFTTALMITLIAHAFGIMLSISMLAASNYQFRTASFFLELAFGLLFFFLVFRVVFRFWVDCCHFTFRTWSKIDHLFPREWLILFCFVLWNSSHIF